MAILKRIFYFLMKPLSRWLNRRLADRLSTIHPGDHITITCADGKPQEFRVNRVRVSILDVGI